MCPRVLVVMLVAASIPAYAQEPPRLSLDAAIHEALAHSPELGASADAVALADIQRRLVASQFALKVTPSVSTMSDPVGGSLRMAGVTMTKALPTGGQAFVNLSASAFGSSATGFRDAGYTVGVSQPLLRGLWTTAA